MMFLTSTIGNNNNKKVTRKNFAFRGNPSTSCKWSCDRTCQAKTPHKSSFDRGLSESTDSVCDTESMIYNFCYVNDIPNIFNGVLTC